MKKVGLFIVLGLGVIIAVAIFSAGEMGEKSLAFAKGTVVLDDALMSETKNIKALFLIVRDANQPMPPFGAIKITLDQPIKKNVYDFILTYDNLNRMVETKAWPEIFHIKARLDQDGFGGMDQPGDLTGMTENLTRGAEGVEVKINSKF